MKGVFVAAVLAAVEETCDTTIVDHFDLVVGTSTGGIIALGLGLGMSPRQILEFYIEEGRSIFPGGVLRNIGRFYFTKYKSEPLEGALKQIFGKRTLGQSSKRLVIPSYDLTTGEVCLYKTRHSAHYSHDYKLPAWKIALATSAAPTYFPTCRVIDQRRLIDGGVWANNPAMVGLTEAVGVLNHRIENVNVLSLGTTGEVVDNEKRLDSGGFWQWKYKGIDTVMNAQSDGIDKQMGLMLTEERYLRINPKVPEAMFKMDGLIRVDELIGLARGETRKYSVALRQRFLDHRAVPFQAYE